MRISFRKASHALGRSFGIMGPGNRIPPEAFNRLAMIFRLECFYTLYVPLLPNSPAAPVALDIIYQTFVEPSQKGVLGHANAIGSFNRTKHNPKSSKVNISIFGILIYLSIHVKIFFRFKPEIFKNFSKGSVHGFGAKYPIFSLKMS
jgi:hypothetical protein